MMDWVCIRLSSLFLSVCQNTCVILCSRLHQSRHALRPGGPDFPRLYRSVQCCLLLIQKHRPVPTFNYFTAQSLHSRYGSADPCPTLRTHVTTLFTRTRYGRLAIPYPTGFSCCVSPAYKDCSRNQWKNSLRCFLSSHSEKCVMCHGKTVYKISETVIYGYPERQLVVKNVPRLECQKCGFMMQAEPDQNEKTDVFINYK